jgi:hypothetical protein
MNNWRGAFHILKFELKRDRLGFLFNIVFYTYLVVVLTPITDVSEENARQIHWVKDLLYIALLPNMGFIMNYTIFRYWQDDLYSRRLVMWRTLPISVDQIVLARLMNLKLIMVLSWFYFFSLQYSLEAIFYKAPDLLPYIGQALFWLGYSVVISVTYAFWEICYSGKVFVIVSIPYIIVFGLITYLFFALDISIVYVVHEYVQLGNWWPPLLAVLAGAGALWAGYLFITKRLKKRVIY